MQKDLSTTYNPENILYQEDLKENERWNKANKKMENMKEDLNIQQIS